MDYEGIGDTYQQITKYARNAMPRHRLNWSAQPALQKSYPKAKKTVAPTPPQTSGGPPVWDVIRARRSLRSYTREPISMEELSQLLWATQGTTLEVSGYKFRSSPSAGALYPVETYVVVNRANGLEAGVYHYDAVGGNLQLLESGNCGARAAAAALDQPMAEQAAVVFVWTAVVERAKWKYLERAYRYIYLDAGHIGQNLYLAATALGLGCCAIGALYDEEVNELVQVDGENETVVYMCTVGKL
jgi:SagB-type dehydrogenase family enzyme